MQFFKLSALAALATVAVAQDAPTYSTVTLTTTRTVMRVVQTVTSTSSYSSAMASSYVNNSTAAYSGGAGPTGSAPITSASHSGIPVSNDATALSHFSAAGLAAVAGLVGYIVI